MRAEARAYLPWVVAAPLIGIAAWMLDGIFIGATETRAMRNAMLLSVAVYACALALLLPRFGNHGLWAALMILNVTRGVTLALRYPRWRPAPPEPSGGRASCRAAGSAPAAAPRSREPRSSPVCSRIG